jgi:pantetheine-phosphate adenylyltransferase
VRSSVCPGTFDPVTKGHLDIITRAAKIFDHVYVTVQNNPSKTPLFSVEERVELLRHEVASLENVSVESFDGLVVEYAKMKNAIAIVRGLRAVTDFEFEFKLASMNRNLAPEVETIFMMTSSEYSFISSSAIKEVASLGGDVSRWVSREVANRLFEKYGLQEGGKRESD